MKPIVSVSGLSKTYKLYSGPRDLFKEILLGIPSRHQLIALKDISFELTEGEAFGIVGDNGAGKSTLLKILTGTTFPTSGTAQTLGRVGSLLELGAGFHPEFTGRENIYFNGAAMGLGRREVARHEEQIVEFSELGSFIDEPVRTYSSGMYLRLGFSVATGFDFSVLIIDEALAVGDQGFQKKCTDRIVGFKKAGKTILFCSHSLYQVRTLCDRALWLERGVAKGMGQSDEVVDQYTAFLRQQTETALESTTSQRQRNDLCWIESVRTTDSQGETCREFNSGETIQIEVEAYFGKQFEGTPGIGVSLLRNDGVIVYTTANTIDEVGLVQVSQHHYRTTLAFPECPLLPGSYYLNVVTTDQDFLQSYDVVEKASPFRVVDPRPDFGVVRLNHQWRVRG